MSQHLIVLADDAAHRAVPLWLRGVGYKELVALMARPDMDVGIGGTLQTAARLLDTAGVTVTAVDIEPASEDAPELRFDTVTARVELATAEGGRHAVVSAEYGLALATVARAPVRVTDAVLDRLAVPVEGEDVLAPFLPPAAARPPKGPRQQRRFEPRNMEFADGMDYWVLAGSFSEAGQPHWQDYSCTVADRSAVLASAVPQPSGFAVIVQTIYADDYRGAAVTFRGQLRVTGLAGHAGLHLAAGRRDGFPRTQPLDGGGSSMAAPGSSDWTWHEVTVPVPGDAGAIRFGISLAGRGRVELRGAELTPAPPGTRE